MDMILEVREGTEYVTFIYVSFLKNKTNKKTPGKENTMFEFPHFGG